MEEEHYIYHCYSFAHVHNNVLKFVTLAQKFFCKMVIIQKDTMKMQAMIFFHFALYGSSLGNQAILRSSTAFL